MYIVVVIQKIHESLSLRRNQTECVVSLWISKVSAVRVEDFSNLGVFALEDGDALVYLLVVVDDDPLLDEAEAQTLHHLLQQLRATARGYLAGNMHSKNSFSNYNVPYIYTVYRVQVLSSRSVPA